MWPDRRLIDLLDLEHPIIQAPMAGAATPELASAVSAAGGLGSLGCALWEPEEVAREAHHIRSRTNRPFNLNFFCHRPPRADPRRWQSWLERLRPYYEEFGIAERLPSSFAGGGARIFDEAMCEAVLAIAPAVVSFHYGLPAPELVSKLKQARIKILCSATSVREAKMLAAGGVDVIIAQGVEAGGHRGTFDPGNAGLTGSLALIPQIVDAVEVPVVAAGGIADGRGIAAAFALGASGVQIGTAYLFCPETRVSGPHRAALRTATDDGTVLTNVFSGRPARSLANRLTRELGPMAEDIPDFPLLVPTIGPLRQEAEARGSGDFGSLWAGQAAPLGRETDAATLTQDLARQALERFASLRGA